MHHSCLTSLFLALLLALAMLSQTGCVIPAVCDPDSEQFDPEECAQVCRLNSTSPFNEGCEYVTFLARLNKAAYGTFPGSPPSSFDYSCPSRLTCDDPVCVTVEQNGGFERPPGSELPPALWFGDKVEKDEIRCDGVGGLRFIATTPDGPGPSASAQVFQVFDYHALVPEVDHARLNRVRAQAALHVLGSEPDDDRQFGLQINAYAGDPATFPREGDPEVFLPDVPGLLAETRKTVLSMGDTTTWQPVRAELLLPEGTDYFVVFLEAVEDVQNDVTGDEFRSHRMDAVQVVIDAGNTAPVARPFTVQTPQGAAIYIAVSNHAYDLTSPLDRTSVVIVQPPSFGVAMLTPLTPPGFVLYTPNPLFLGTDTFTYTIADEEGLRSNEATVTIEIHRNSDNTCTFQSQLICTAVGSPFCEQRVVQGDFFGFSYLPDNLPMRTGIWSGTGLSAVGPRQGIIPCQGSQMLQFVSTEYNPFAEIFLPIVQLIDLSDAAAQAAISEGNVTLKARALFNRIAGDDETDTRFDIAVRAYEGDPSEYPQRVGMPLGSQAFMLFSDADPGTWEEAYVALPLDPRTTYVALRLFAYENVVNDFPPAIEFDGHYVDNVRVVLDRE